MAKHRTHSIEFKRQIALDFIAGETLHGLAKRHDISRNLIRIWVKKLEAGAFDEDARAADLPLIGARSRSRLVEALELADLELTRAISLISRQPCRTAPRLATLFRRISGAQKRMDNRASAALANALSGRICFVDRSGLRASRRTARLGFSPTRTRSCTFFLKRHIEHGDLDKPL